MIGQNSSSRELFLAVCIFFIMGFGALCIDASGSSDELRFRNSHIIDHWGKADGLPSDSIHSIARTRDGFLWIATEKGLVQYDGIEFRVVPFYSKSKNAPLENGVPGELAVTQGGELWIASDSGLSAYDHIRRVFKTYRGIPGLSRQKVRRLRVLSNRELWISMFSGGVYRCVQYNFTPFNKSHGLEGEKINAVLETRDGAILFADRIDGVFQFEDGKFRKRHIPGLGDRHIISMVEDQHGALWIGTTNGLIRTDGVNTRVYGVKDGLIDKRVTFLLQDSPNTMWAGTMDGLDRLRFDAGQEIKVENVIGSVVVNCVFIDPEGSIWVATDRRGLMRIKKRRFFSCPVSRTNDDLMVISAFLDTDGRVLLGTYKGDIFSIGKPPDIKTILSPEITNGSAITAIARDNENNLCFATNGKGVFKKDKQNKNRYKNITKSDGLADNIVTSIYKDREGNLWFSTFNGASVLPVSGGPVQSITQKSGLAGKIVYSVTRDSHGDVWIATDGGITILSGGKWSDAYSPRPFIHIPVTLVYQDPGHSRLYWVVTKHSGLARFDMRPGNKRPPDYFHLQQGLPARKYFQLAEDAAGNFWLTCDTGVIRVNKNHLNQFIQGKRSQIDCLSFDESDGLPGIEYHNETSPHSLLDAGDRGLWFMTKKGVSIAHPGSIPVNKYAPPVVFRTIKIGIYDVPAEMFTYEPSPIPFSAVGDIDARFEFTSPTFLSPRKVKFKYRLLGLDDQWRFIYPGGERVVTYPPLGPGSYTFELMAGNADGIWNPEPRTFTFIVKHNIKAFLIKYFAVLSILFALFLFIYFKRKSKKQRQAQETRTQEPVSEAEPQKPIEDSYQTPQLAPAYIAQCIEKLDRLMEEKIYRDPEISLPALAEKIPMPHHKLSRILNETLKKGFNDYINTYRIEEAKAVMLGPEGDDKNVTAIAFDVGFNTMTAFYKAFRKQTGTTPKEFKKRNRPDST